MASDRRSGGEGEATMTVAMVMEYPGATAKQYDEVMRILSLDNELADGALFHLAGPIPGGWRVIDVWGNKEEFERFRRQRLGAAMYHSGMHRPRPVTGAVHNTLGAAPATLPRSAIILVAETPGGTAEQYDALVKALELDANPPDGAVLHVAGPIEGGWRVIDVWESQSKFDEFLLDRLGPAMDKVGQAKPNVTVGAAHSVRESAPVAATAR
jgi:hypothetical protein